MIRSALIIFNLLFVLTAMVAQNLRTGAYFEKTVPNLQVGFSSGVLIKGSWEMGGFYQKEMYGQQFYESAPHPAIEKTYAGLYIQHPVFHYQGCPLNLNVRTGIRNGNRILIAPSLRYEIALGKRLIADAGLGGAGIGSGNFRPTMFFGLKLRQ